MGKLFRRMKNVTKKGDMILLALCVTATLFGLVMIYAATATADNSRYIIIQSACLIVGVGIYLALTAFDIDILAGQRTLLFLFNAFFIGLLLIFGVEVNGNRSWLHFFFLPFNIQPAEVCKITYVIILARTLSVNQTRTSSIKCVGQLVFHMLFIVGWYVFISSDTGVSLIFIFTFLIMAYVGGVNGLWFLAGGGAIAVAAPFLWTNIMRQDQRNRILALYDNTIDPNGLDTMWQTNQNLKTLRNGGLSGQGLFNGMMTNSGAIPARHTDSIFSTIGEQLGMIGCLAVLILLFAIVARVIYVGVKTPDYQNRLICMGIAAMFLFQIIINVGVCLGLLPVIGLALPFFSYGGSSIITSFIAMGIVSGIKMRPAPDPGAHYIRPY
ncbi:MAG: FtsW/RodA/SpoVE family cell cycle protein [Oscillospiraceae bacterium]|nr:FtsW/RodA/SpoVE family cell cycle protein [Oscillospiraceae bacterium]